jgi:hypothetical protein
LVGRCITANFSFGSKGELVGKLNSVCFHLRR